MIVSPTLDRALDSGLRWKSSNRGQQMLTYRGLPQKCTCAIKKCALPCRAYCLTEPNDTRELDFLRVCPRDSVLSSKSSTFDFYSGALAAKINT